MDVIRVDTSGQRVPNERGQFQDQPACHQTNDTSLSPSIILEEGEEQDPQFLERLRAQAMTFSLREGEQRSVVSGSHHAVNRGGLKASA